jgi:hypothetical protein
MPINEWSAGQEHVQAEEQAKTAETGGMLFFQSPADEAEVKREIAEGVAEDEPREPGKLFFAQSLGAFVVDPLEIRRRQGDNNGWIDRDFS